MDDEPPDDRAGDDDRDGSVDSGNDDAGWETNTESDDSEWGRDDESDDSEWAVSLEDLEDDPETATGYGTSAGGEASVGGGAPTRQSRGEEALGPRLWSVVVCLGIAIAGFVAGVVAILGIALALTFAGVEISATDELFVSLVGLQGIGFPVTAALYLRYTGRDWRQFIPVRWPSILEGLLIVGATVGSLILVGIVANLLVVLSGTEPAANAGGQTVQENPEIVPFLLPFVLLFNGPGEELLFRGVIQGRFREEFGAAASIVLASLMFAPAHILSLVGSVQAALLSIAVLTVPSLVFGAVYEYTENFVVPALVHGLYNSILFGLLYIVAVYGPESATNGLIVV